MHDIKAIRDNPDAYIEGWTVRGVENAREVVAEILGLDRDLRAAQTRGQEALAQRNAASKAIGAAMGRKDMAEADRLKAEVESLKGQITESEAAERDLFAKLSGPQGLLAGLKNLAGDDVPDGDDEAGNVQVGDAFGTPRTTGPAKDHADLGEALGLIDFEAAAKMSGARFAVLKGGIARLERAIGQFMLDMQTGQHGYLEVNPPYLVRDEAMFGTGQLPKFEEDLFSTARIDDTKDQPGQNVRFVTDKRYLIPTAEVSLTNLVREQILSEDDLATPMRLTALTPCFRAEAGSAGRDTRGLIRQHQFSKVELVSITRPEDSNAEHERMTECAEAVLKALELPFRRMLLCKGDMGFSARKTYDLEVWLPSQGTYREISSCSNCGDFQARRMDARFTRAGEKKTEFVHTLNGSGLAVGRTLVAVMENYQQDDGRIAVPAVLQSYMGGATHVG
jgi:seryl-tRNA synthetase